MKVYIVGGAVRDFALGLDPKDMDYVIVGATVEEALANLPHLRADTVGNDFPVFLDMDGNEYALARKERKVGSGYGGFEVETSNLYPELAQAFIEAGYDLEEEYEVSDLLEFLRCINL